MRFDKRYKVYLDWTVPKGMMWNNDDDANWVEIFQEVTPLEKAPFNKEMFSRYDWDKITLRNEPKYAGDAAHLYFILSNIAIDQEVRIKVVVPSDMVDPDTITIRGYFGTNDCEFDGDRKSIIIAPTILDQYTDLVENWETKIDIFPQITEGRTTWATSEILNLSNGFWGTHNLPVEVTSSNMNESNSPSDVFDEGIANSILTTLTESYESPFSVTINGTVTLSAGNTMTFYLNTYDSDDVLVTEYELAEFTEGTDKVIASTFNEGVTLNKGEYVRLINVVSNPDSNDIIYYDSINASVDARNEPYTTTEIDVNIQDSDLRTPRDIWVGQSYGSSIITYSSQYESDIPTLRTYFNANGSPKEELLKGTDANRYAPESRLKKITLITENGIETLNIDSLYITDLEQSLSPSGFELSEVTVYDYWHYEYGTKSYTVKTLCTCKFSRFERRLPDGEELEGWIDTGYIDSNAKRLWVKIPFDGAITDWTIGSIQPAGNLGGTEYRSSITSSKLENYPSADNSLTLQTRDFRDVVKTMYNSTYPSLTNNDINSVFFWNDPSTEISVETGINYVTTETNWLNNIACAHTYQLKTEDNESQESTLEISFKELMDDLKVFFNKQIFWWIEEDGTLNIEHIEYIDKNADRSILDLTDTESDVFSYNQGLLSELSKWSHDKSEMFSLVEFKMLNSDYVDFTKNKITYDKIVSNKRNEDIQWTLATKIISTDIRYGIESPDDLENGMFLLNHDNNNDVIVANVPVSNILFENGNLALSNILTRYKYEGIFLSGTINGSNVLFDITTRTKVGKEFTIKGIYNYEYFQNILGVGRIKTLTHDLNKENTKITLTYRFGSGSHSDNFILMVSEVGDYTGATDVQFNFG